MKRFGSETFDIFVHFLSKTLHEVLSERGNIAGPLPQGGEKNRQYVKAII